MEVRLSVTNGKANVKQVVLGAETIIGRSHECNLKIASSQVSRRHCRIVCGDSEVKVSDLGSANGTFLNGRALPPETETVVTPGNALTIGPLRFVFHFKPPVPPKAVSTVPESDTKDAIPLALMGRPASELGEEETVDSASPKRAGAAAASPLGPAATKHEETSRAPAQDEGDFEEGLPDRTMSGLKEGPVVVSPPEGVADTVLDMNLAEEARRKAALQEAARTGLPPGEVPESNTDSGTALMTPEKDLIRGSAPLTDDTVHIDDPDFPDFKAVDLAADDDEDSEESPRTPVKGRKAADKSKEKKPWNLLGGMFGKKAKPKLPSHSDEELVEESDDFVDEIEESPIESPAAPVKTSGSKPQPKQAEEEPDEIGLPVSFSAPEPVVAPQAAAPAPAGEFDPADFLMSLAGKDAEENLDPVTKLPGEKPTAAKPPEKRIAPRLSPLEKPSAKASSSPEMKPQVKSSGSADRHNIDEADGSLDDFLKNL